MTEYCGNFELKNGISKCEQEIIHELIDSAYISDNNVEIDVGFGFVDCNDLNNLQKELLKNGNEIVSGEIRIWGNCDEDTNLIFSKADGEWLEFEQTFLCDVDTEDLLKELRRRQKGKASLQNGVPCPCVANDDLISKQAVLDIVLLDPGITWWQLEMINKLPSE